MRISEIAFVGFGSDVVRISSNPAIQVKLRLNAQNVAEMRANDALVGTIIGDDTFWKGKTAVSDKQILKDYEDSDPGKDASTKDFESKNQAFVNSQGTSPQFESIRSGRLPPGVTQKTFTSEDNSEVYAVAVYLPSVSQRANQAAKDMSEAKIITPLSNEDSSSGSGDSKTSSQNVDVQRPSRTVSPGPSGPVTSDKDL